MLDLIKKAEKFKYKSLEYIESEDILNAEILADDDEALVIYTKESERLKIDWATNSPTKLMIRLKELINRVSFDQEIKKIHIEFIPEEIVPELEAYGFKISSEWVDFWNNKLEKSCYEQDKSLIIRNIIDREYHVASEITKSCKGISRGYYGESVDWIKDWYEKENSQVYVAEINNKIIGVCCVSLYGFDSSKGTVLWIREVAVDPNYHSQKIGLNLMSFAIDWGKKNGAKRSFLACDMDNRKAIRLYEGLGYEKISERGQINMEKNINR
ncbi:GNAT family N-acetyltransferase [Alkaliphilus transvaalensis]|uniref:GNAT family N-acetyltransferase n=1 Tax=Alkaliphilus transvaalensis TaxID=114628 RepID=UPI00047A19F0|nr:GNAT family N-acetyltransferase [Alkaliphilus transvaalensis]